MKKKAMLLMAIIVLLAGCHKAPKPEEHKEKIAEIEDNNIDQEFTYSKHDNDKKINIGKEIQYIQIKEVNNKALSERPFGGISSQQSIYYDSNNLLYLFYDAEVPDKNTQMIITYEKFNEDYLLDYDLINSKDSKVSLDSRVDGQLIKDNKKLIQDNNRLIKNVSVENVKDEIKVHVNDKVEIVKYGETKEIEFSNGDITSKLVVSNHKLKNDGIVYQEPSKELKKEMELIKKNKVKF